MSDSPSPVVVVTGANGLVGAAVCEALSERGAVVRAVVRRPGSAPDLAGVREVVGDFADPEVARRAVAGATALVTTVHPLGGDRESQQRVAVEGTPVVVRAARDAGVPTAVHVSTAAVYVRDAETGDVDEDGTLVSDDDSDYAVTKRDTDRALADIDGITRVLVRPPAILGAGETSVWNTLRPRQIRDDAAQRSDVAERTFAWVHVRDLAALLADVATGAVPVVDADPAAGPVAGECTAVNVAGEPATMRDYLGTVAEALGVEPAWKDEPVWTGDLLADRARAWGWSPAVTLRKALEELASGLRQR